MREDDSTDAGSEALGPLGDRGNEPLSGPTSAAEPATGGMGDQPVGHPPLSLWERIKHMVGR
jgi:hypothetical protein